MKEKASSYSTGRQQRQPRHPPATLPLPQLEPWDALQVDLLSVSVQVMAKSKLGGFSVDLASRFLFSSVDQFL